MSDESKELAFLGIDKEGFPTVREPIKISLSSFKNAKYLDIRKYFDKNGEWLPTSKGITISGKAFSEFLDVLIQNKEEIEKWVSDEKK
jgi:hypothetical protein